MKLTLIKKASKVVHLIDFFFHACRRFLYYSPSLDTETESGYGNYKSYYWKSNILWFSGMTANRKNGDMPRTEDTYC